MYKRQELIPAIAKDYGVECMDCYTGFKWIANEVREQEGKRRYIGGGEESYGYLWEDVYKRQGYTVRNNRFVDHSGKAIYVTRASEVLIEGNEMVQQIAPQRDYSGIDATFHTDAKIIGNDFDITQPEASRLSNLVGINVREVQGEGLLVANNVIRITRGCATSLSLIHI